MQVAVVIEREQIGAVPLLIARPSGAGTYPLILALHGYTGNKETMLPLIEPLAGADFVVAAPDAKYHGERADERWTQYAQSNESLAISRAIFETAGELPALIDALLAKPYVRLDGAGGVGVVGVSMGALTLYASVPLEAHHGGRLDHRWRRVGRAVR